MEKGSKIIKGDMYMEDPFNELLDLALETLTLNFEEFLLPDHQVSGLEVEQLEARITGLYNRIKEITTNMTTKPEDTCITRAMIYEVCRYIGSVPGYSVYDNIISEKRNAEGKLIPELKDTRRLINIKQQLMAICSLYCSSWNLNIDKSLTEEQRTSLQGRINDAISKGKANAAAANAFLEGAADANPENAPPGYQPPPGSFRGDKFHEIVESDDLHKLVASYLKGGKRKSKKQRNKTRKRDKKSKLRKRKTSYRKSKR